MTEQSTNHFLNNFDAYSKEHKIYIKPDDKAEILQDMALIFEQNMQDKSRKVSDVE
jgi:hypothetical protein